MDGQTLYRLLATMVPKGGSLLDLACGDGTFLREALSAGATRAVGVELSEEGVLRCVAAGLTVHQGDITEGLADYPDASFDCVSLIRTVELLPRPGPVLQEMLRVGRRVLLTFTNHGHWRERARFLRTGLPPGAANGLDGSPTRLSLSLLRHYCRKNGIEIVRCLPFPGRLFDRLFPGVFARELAVVLAKPVQPRRKREASSM